MQLESDLVPGDSGAPIFNSQGEVVAIGMGGLRSGTIGVSWAVDSLKLHDLKVEDNAALVAKARTVVKTMFSYRESDAPDGSPTLPRSYQTSFELSGQNALGPFIPTEPFYSRCSPLSSRFTKWGRSEFAHSGRFSINLIPEGNPETGYARTNGCSSPTQTISAAELSSPLNTSGMDIVAISYFELSRSNPRTKDVHNCDSSLNVYYALDQGDWKLYSAMCGSHRSENHTWAERRLLIPTSGASSMRLAFTYTLQNSSHPDPEAAYFIDDFQMEARRLVDETATY